MLRRLGVRITGLTAGITPRLQYCSKRATCATIAKMRLVRWHDLFGKPLHTFPDHALDLAS
jgi:hypothetical protein